MVGTVHAFADAFTGTLAVLANGILDYSETFYYGHAAHRHVAVEAPAVPAKQDLVIFPGMTDFEPAPPYLETLRVQGYPATVFRSSSPAQEGNHLRNARDIAAEAVLRLIENPAFLESSRIFVGHSAGGFPTFVLAALAKGANLAGLKTVLPALADIPDRDLQSLAARLRRSRFIALSSPLNGLRLSRLGRALNRWVLEPIAPQLVTGLTEDSLNEVYRKLKVRPGQVLDGNIVSIDSALVFRGGPASWVAHAAIQGGMRLFSPFLDHRTDNDGIVPMDAALLNGPLQMLVSMDHLKLVESPEAARALVHMIEQIEQSHRINSVAVCH